MISLDNLKTTINAIKYLLTNYPKKKDIPTKFPNPNPLTFSGAITGSHNGSEILTVEISETLILYPSTNNLTKNTFNKKIELTVNADIVLTVGSILTSKQTSIIYNSSDGKYYLWR